ncbi:unnamed protein product [Chondrus crispus]|uniref:Secreted protein n=1 Tax=Chondrus crispus TaxID=2769 RepID=R7QQR8_CHOCR|nr:unnamed protein product [Chondrus crispus]CDF39831.1 unnamed protein product [Chondrus crispus]|eukprot:XP_005710125.1 unnamed protein product [Chondrus crispus]
MPRLLRFALLRFALLCPPKQVIWRAMSGSYVLIYVFKKSKALRSITVFVKNLKVFLAKPGKAKQKPACSGRRTRSEGAFPACRILHVYIAPPVLHTAVAPPTVNTTKVLFDESLRACPNTAMSLFPI